MTVSTDTPSATAVSSTLSPPKKRISTTLLLRSSTGASASSASSSARRSRQARPTHQRFVQGHFLRAAATFLVVPRARVIHQDPPHQSRRHREKVRAVLPLDSVDIDQPEIRLVDERRRLQRVTHVLVPHVVPGEASELLIDQRRQLFQRRRIPISPLEEKLGHVRRPLRAVWTVSVVLNRRILSHNPPEIVRASYRPPFPPRYPRTRWQRRPKSSRAVL